MPSKSARKNEPSRTRMAKRANRSDLTEVVLGVEPQRMALLQWLAKLVAHEIWNGARNAQRNVDQ